MRNVLIVINAMLHILCQIKPTIFTKFRCYNSSDASAGGVIPPQTLIAADPVVRCRSFTLSLCTGDSLWHAVESVMRQSTQQ